MEDDKPPPLPPKQYKRNSGEIKTVKIVTEQLLLDFNEDCHASNAYTTSNIDNGKVFFNAFEDLSVTRASTSMDSYVQVDYTPTLYNSTENNTSENSNNDYNNTTNHLSFNDTAKGNECSGKTFLASSKCLGEHFFDTSSINQRITEDGNVNNVSFGDTTLSTNSLDDMIFKNFDEFQVKVEESTSNNPMQPYSFKMQTLLEGKCDISDDVLRDVGKNKPLKCKTLPASTVQYHTNNPFCPVPGLYTTTPNSPKLQNAVDQSREVSNKTVKFNITEDEREVEYNCVYDTSDSRGSSKTLPASLQSRQMLRKDRTKSEIFGSLFDKVIETNYDIMDFGVAITDLRKSFKYNDPSSNSGVIKPPVVKNVLPDTTLDVSIFFASDKNQVKSLTCNYSWTCSEIICHCLSTVNNDVDALDLFLLSNQYTLKVVGLDLYLEDSVCLCDYAHIQEHVKRGENIRLALVDKSSVNTNLLRNNKDDLRLNTYFIHFEDFFEKADSISVSEQGLSVLLESYDIEVTKLVVDVSNTAEPTFIPDRMIQVVKAISTVLAAVDIPQIQNAVQLLQSLTSQDCQDANKSSSAVGVNFGYEVIDSAACRFDKEIFDLALQQLTHGIYYLIELYCKSFEFKFNLEAKKMLPKSYTDDYLQVDKTAATTDVFERVDPRTLSDQFVVKVESVNRIPSEWKFNFVDFQLEVGLYYGGELLCPIQKSTKSAIDKGFFEHISFSKLMEFDIPVRQIPREAKIGFVLYGLIATNNTPRKTSLCWFTSNIYDYKGLLISGSRLFGLLHEVEFDPVATCATNYIHHCDTVILKVDFQIYPIEVMFPEPILFLSKESTHDLSESDLNHIKKIVQKDVMYLKEEEKSFIWNNRFSLLKFPKALVYVLLSVPCWDAETVILVHSTLNYWEQLHPHNALQLLGGNFPDKIIREKAVLWINEVSEHEFFDYLPGLVQALKYETHHNSALAQLLIKRAICSIRICHYLYWYLKYYVGDIQFCQRYKTVLSGLLHVCGIRLRAELSKQDELIVALAKVGNLLKESKDSLRKGILDQELGKLNDELDFPLRIPFDPAIKVSRIIPDESSYFNSNAVPLKIAFKNEDALAEDVNVIFKLGDDLRKDLLTLQMFRIMNTLWLNNGLDLKIMLYNVLPTGPYTGLIEIVPNASTLREIHIQYGGVTGSFKDEYLALWLQKFNPTKEVYEKAIANFTASAAGYCVATYILGIGDRHNDNIMITKSGDLFHIDFNKYMGDRQKFGNINRDRVPFILTPDMAYVINNGVTPSQNFQTFIEYCCTAFNIIRRNRSKLLNILQLMMCADISYLSAKEDVDYVYHSLQLQLSDEEAAIYFSQQIQNSLSSMSTQLNFFIHNVAHMRDFIEYDLRRSRSASGFSFTDQIQSFDHGCGVLSARIVDFQKRYSPGKHYVFVINIVESENSIPVFVFRRYEEFQELHTNISNNYSISNGIDVPVFPPKFIIGRSQIREVAQERRAALDKYLVDLSKIPRIWTSDIMATFFHRYIRDHEEEKRFYDSIDYLQDGWKSRIGGKIKVSMVYEKRCFKVFIMHVSDLVPRRIQGLADSYVKSYMLPDFMKHTKRKTKICRKSLNPTFNETFIYNTPSELLKNRILQISVWDQNNITDKEFLGGFYYYLSQFDLERTTNGWFNLVDIDLNK